jgi:hypothetical protein
MPLPSSTSRSGTIFSSRRPSRSPLPRPRTPASRASSSTWRCTGRSSPTRTPRPSTYGVYLETVEDASLRSLLEAQPVDTRLDTLIESGLLADYIGVLEQRAAEIGARYREAVSAAAPGFTIALYFPGIPTCWQYRGLIGGMGEAGNPVIILSYDPFSRPYRADMVAGGAQAVHLGGAIVSLFPPENLTQVLGNCGQYTDGFWYFAHDEVSDITPVDPVFGTRAEYRDAIALAADGM